MKRWKLIVVLVAVAYAAVGVVIQPTWESGIAVAAVAILFGAACALGEIFR